MENPKQFIIDVIKDNERCPLTNEIMSTENDFEGYRRTPEKICPPCELQVGCPRLLKI